MQSPLPSHRVLVWELPVRLFHWMIFLLVAAAYVSWRLNRMDWHVWIGYAALTAVLFRILWGFFGGDCARFAHFLAGPSAAVAHLRHALQREPDRQVGHNAAGGWMVVLLLALLLTETLSGLLVNNDVADEGPLTELLPAPLANAITATHSIGWDLLAGAACLHVAAILLYAGVKRQNLVSPMITGRKALPPEVAAPRRGGALRAIVLLAISALAVAGLARFV
ncbi:MAG TPA: cytochrome b/b6 domain-containing protein [Steroidobacteraceae bacterium]